MSSDSARAEDAGDRVDPRILEILEAYLVELEQGGNADPHELLRRHPEEAERLRPYLASLRFLHQAQPAVPRTLAAGASLATGEPAGKTAAPWWMAPALDRPRWATLAAGVCLLAAVLAAGGWRLVEAGRRHATWQQALHRQEAAAEAQRQAEVRLHVAIDSMDAIVRHVAEVPPAGGQPAAQLRQRLLREVLHFQEALAQSPGSQTGADAHAALARYRMGRIHVLLGDPAAAEQAYVAALHAIRQTSVAPRWQDRQVLRTQAELAAVYLQSGRHTEAEATLRAVLQPQARGQSSGPAPAEFEVLHELDLARCYDLLAANQWQLGRTPGALDAWMQAVQVRQALAQRHPDEPRYRSDLAASYHSLGLACRDAGRYDEGQAHLERAIELRDALIRQFPDELPYQRAVALAWHSRADLYRDARQTELARRAFASALRIQQRLAGEHADWLELTLDLAGTQLDWGRLEAESGDRDGAERLYARCIDSLETVLRQRPDDQRVHQFLHAATTARRWLSE